MVKFHWHNTSIRTSPATTTKARATTTTITTTKTNINKDSILPDSLNFSILRHCHFSPYYIVQLFNVKFPTHRSFVSYKNTIKCSCWFLDHTVQCSVIVIIIVWWSDPCDCPIIITHRLSRYHYKVPCSVFLTQLSADTIFMTKANVQILLHCSLLLHYMTKFNV